MTRLFIYIFAVLIVGQTISIEFLKCLDDIEEVQELLEDMAEESDASEEESMREEYLVRLASGLNKEDLKSISFLEHSRILGLFHESVCIEIPSPPPDKA